MGTLSELMDQSDLAAVAAKVDAAERGAPGEPPDKGRQDHFNLAKRLAAGASDGGLQIQSRAGDHLRKRGSDLQGFWEHAEFYKDAASEFVKPFGKAFIDPRYEGEKWSPPVEDKKYTDQSMGEKVAGHLRDLEDEASMKDASYPDLVTGKRKQAAPALKNSIEASRLFNTYPNVFLNQAELIGRQIVDKEGPLPPEPDDKHSREHDSWVSRRKKRDRKIVELASESMVAGAQRGMEADWALAPAEELYEPQADFPEAALGLPPEEKQVLSDVIPEMNKAEREALHLKSKEELKELIDTVLFDRYKTEHPEQEEDWVIDFPKYEEDMVSSGVPAKYIEAYRELNKDPKARTAYQLRKGVRSKVKQLERQDRVGGSEYLQSITLADLGKKTPFVRYWFGDDYEAIEEAAERLQSEVAYAGRSKDLAMLVEMQAKMVHMANRHSGEDGFKNAVLDSFKEAPAFMAEQIAIALSSAGLGNVAKAGLAARAVKGAGAIGKTVGGASYAGGLFAAASSDAGLAAGNTISQQIVDSILFQDDVSETDWDEKFTQTKKEGMASAIAERFADAAMAGAVSGAKRTLAAARPKVPPPAAVPKGIIDKVISPVTVGDSAVTKAIGEGVQETVVESVATNAVAALQDGVGADPTLIQAASGDKDAQREVVLSAVAGAAMGGGLGLVGDIPKVLTKEGRLRSNIQKQTLSRKQLVDVLGKDAPKTPMNGEQRFQAALPALRQMGYVAPDATELYKTVLADAYVGESIQEGEIAAGEATEDYSKRLAENKKILARMRDEGLVSQEERAEILKAVEETPMYPSIEEDADGNTRLRIYSDPEHVNLPEKFKDAAERGADAPMSHAGEWKLWPANRSLPGLGKDGSLSKDIEYENWTDSAGNTHRFVRWKRGNYTRKIIDTTKQLLANDKDVPARNEGETRKQYYERLQKIADELTTVDEPAVAASYTLPDGVTVTEGEGGLKRAAFKSKEERDSWLKKNKDNIDVTSRGETAVVGEPTKYEASFTVKAAAQSRPPVAEAPPETETPPAVKDDENIFSPPDATPPPSPDTEAPTAATVEDAAIEEDVVEDDAAEEDPYAGLEMPGTDRAYDTVEPPAADTEPAAAEDTAEPETPAATEVEVPPEFYNSDGTLNSKAVRAGVRDLGRSITRGTTDEQLVEAWRAGTIGSDSDTLTKKDRSAKKKKAAEKKAAAAPEMSKEDARKQLALRMENHAGFDNKSVAKNIDLNAAREALEEYDTLDDVELQADILEQFVASKGRKKAAKKKAAKKKKTAKKKTAKKKSYEAMSRNALATEVRTRMRAAGATAGVSNAATESELVEALKQLDELNEGANPDEVFRRVAGKAYRSPPQPTEEATEEVTEDVDQPEPVGEDAEEDATLPKWRRQWRQNQEGASAATMRWAEQLLDIMVGAQGARQVSLPAEEDPMVTSYRINDPDADLPPDTEQSPSAQRPETLSRRDIEWAVGLAELDFSDVPVDQLPTAEQLEGWHREILSRRADELVDFGAEQGNTKRSQVAERIWDTVQRTIIEGQEEGEQAQIEWDTEGDWDVDDTLHMVMNTENVVEELESDGAPPDQIAFAKEVRRLVPWTVPTSRPTMREDQLRPTPKVTTPGEATQKVNPARAGYVVDNAIPAAIVPLLDEVAAARGVEPSQLFVKRVEKTTREQPEGFDKPERQREPMLSGEQITEWVTSQWNKIVNELPLDGTETDAQKAKVIEKRADRFEVVSRAVARADEDQKSKRTRKKELIWTEEMTSEEVAAEMGKNLKRAEDDIRRKDMRNVNISELLPDIGENIAQFTTDNSNLNRNPSFPDEVSRAMWVEELNKRGQGDTKTPGVGTLSFMNRQIQITRQALRKLAEATLWPKEKTWSEKGTDQPRDGQLKSIIRAITDNEFEPTEANLKLIGYQLMSRLADNAAPGHKITVSQKDLQIALLAEKLADPRDLSYEDLKIGLKSLDLAQLRSLVELMGLDPTYSVEELNQMGGDTPEFMEQFFQTLGLDITATIEDVGAAKKKLVKRYHPDKKKTGDPQKFKEVVNAFETITDWQGELQYSPDVASRRRFFEAAMLRSALLAPRTDRDVRAMKSRIADRVKSEQDKFVVAGRKQLAQQLVGNKLQQMVKRIHNQAKTKESEDVLSQRVRSEANRLREWKSENRTETLVDAVINILDDLGFDADVPTQPAGIRARQIWVAKEDITVDGTTYKKGSKFVITYTDYTGKELSVRDMEFNNDILMSAQSLVQQMSPSETTRKQMPLTPTSEDLEAALGRIKAEIENASGSAESAELADQLIRFFAAGRDAGIMSERLHKLKVIARQQDSLFPEELEAFGVLFSRSFTENQANFEGTDHIDLWDAPEQEFTSAATSTKAKTLPAIFSSKSDVTKFVKGGINADIGGGKFDTATTELGKRGVTNLIYDPFNRSSKHNERVASQIRNGQADTATVSNVLNVIKEKANRLRVIMQASNAIKENGEAYFTVYEDAKKKEGATGKDQYQLHRKAQEYLTEVETMFDEVHLHKGVIIARRPKRAMRDEVSINRKMTPDEALAKFKKTRMVSANAAYELLGGKPEYLSDIQDYMDEQKRRLLAGEITSRDVAKAYAITIASQGAGSITVSRLQKKLEGTNFGRWLQSKDGQEFLEMSQSINGQGEATIRPEEIAGGWLLSPEGQKALDLVEAGKYRPAHWQGLRKLRNAFGDDRFHNLNALATDGRQMSMKDVAKVRDIINSDPTNFTAIDEAFQKMGGISEGKSGFIMHFLGMDNKTTIDARQINFWLTGQGDISTLTNAAAEMARAVRSGGVMDTKFRGREIARRIRDNNDRLIRLIKEKMPHEQELSRHIMHQWLWDASMGETSPHTGMYHAMRLASKDENVIHGSFIYQPETQDSIISLFETSNIETVVHELGHWFRSMLPGKELNEIGNIMLAENSDLKTDENGNLVWDVAAEEYFVDEFINYVRNGETEIKDLKTTFQRLADWLSSLWKSFKEGKAKPPTTEAFQKFFDTMLSNSSDVSYEAESYQSGDMIGKPRVLFHADGNRVTVEDFASVSDNMRSGQSIKGSKLAWFFRGKGSLPLKVRKQLLDKDGKMSAIQREIRMLNADLDRELDKTYGTLLLGKKVWETKIPPDVLEHINTALKSRGEEFEAAVANIPENLRAPLMAMKSRITEMSEMLQDSGLLDGKEALYAIIDSNKGMYMNRSYRAFDEPGWTATFVKNNHRDRWDGARDYLREVRAKEISDGIMWYDSGKINLDDEFAGRKFRVTAAENADGTYTLTYGDGSTITLSEADYELSTEKPQEYKEDAVSDDELDKAVAALFDKSTNAARFNLSNIMSNEDLSIFKKRKDIPEAIRKLWGEYEEIDVQFAKTMTKMADMAYSHEFWSNMADDGEGTLFFDDETDAQTLGVPWDEMEQFPENHPMKGKRTYKWLADELRYWTEAKASGDTPIAKIGKLYLSTLGLIKIGKTALSLATQIGNFIANPVVQIMSGNWNFLRFPKDAKKVIEDWRNSTGKEKRAKINEYYKLNILGGEAGAFELTKALDFIGSEGTTDALMTAGQTRLAALLKPGVKITKEIRDKALAMYRAGDSVWRIYAYESFKQRYKGMTIDGVKLEGDALNKFAAERVQAEMMDAQMSDSRFLDTMRKLPVGETFITFPVEMKRVLFNQVLQAVKEVRWWMQNPTDVRMAKSAGLRIAGLTAASGVTAFTRQAIEGFLGLFTEVDDIDDDKKEERRAFVPHWDRDGDLVWFKSKEKGKLSYINISSRDPYGQVKDLFRVLERSLKGSDGDVIDAVVDMVFETAAYEMRENTGWNILANGLMNTANNQDRWGRKLIKDKVKDSMGDKLGLLGNFISAEAAQELFNPADGLFSFGILTQGARIYKGETGQTRGSRDYNRWSEVANLFGAGRIATVDITKATQINVGKFDRAEQDTWRDYAASVNELGPGESEAVEKMTAEVREKTKSIAEQRQVLVLSYENHGGDLKKIGHSKDAGLQKAMGQSHIDDRTLDAIDTPEYRQIAAKELDLPTDTGKRRLEKMDEEDAKALGRKILRERSVSDDVLSQMKSKNLTIREMLSALGRVKTERDARKKSWLRRKLTEAAQR